MLAEDATPKLIDFGVAMDKRDVLRNTGARTGRPSYMAPELIRENIFNERTDIYAFGVTMYETLTGRKPFESADRYSTMHLQLNVNPFPPSRHNPEITPELEAITLKAMAKDAAARYRSMDELYVALTALRGLSI
jgi:serine/threonine-protein kinase